MTVEAVEVAEEDDIELGEVKAERERSKGFRLGPGRS